jgi:hypothetical protein
VIVEVLVFIPSVLLVELFRRTSPRRLLSPLRQTLYKLKPKSIPSDEFVENKKKEKTLMFPWWFLFIGYGLSFILFIISTFFIIVRGIEFGDLKTQKWLTSLISGFFSSILLIQPLKVNRSFPLLSNRLNLDFVRSLVWQYSLRFLFVILMKIKKQLNISTMIILN